MSREPHDRAVDGLADDGDELHVQAVDMELESVLEGESGTGTA